MVFTLRATAFDRPPSAGEVREALARSTAYLRSVAVEGGFVWSCAADLSDRRGEEPVSSTQVWVQPPGTPAVGLTFLRTYAATGDLGYLEAARAAASALARGQLESGGWDYLIEFDPARRRYWKYHDDLAGAGESGTPRKNVSTYDDNNTQGVLRFLLAFAEAAKPAADPRDAQLTAALEYGLSKFLEAQYPNGAWPQRWDGRPRDPVRRPVKPAGVPADYSRVYPAGVDIDFYFDDYTFNDDTHRDAVLLLLEAHARTGRERFRTAARRAADFILLAQLPEPQPAWAQQYDAAMHPSWARAFEPPAISSLESGGVVKLLLTLSGEFGDERYLAAAGRAVDWLRRSAIGPDRWARYYELQTNRPIYGDWDGKIHYRLAELSEERRRGYHWEGAFDIPATIRLYEQAVAGGAGANRRVGPAPATPDMRSQAARVRKVLDALDARGRWLEPGGARFTTERFIANSELLCDYLIALESVRSTPVSR